MSREPWGWDDAEGEEARAARRPIDHTHTCSKCGSIAHCYAPGCGVPREFRCGRHAPDQTTEEER